MTSIFLSYSKRDHARVRPLVAALEAHGHSVWWDHHLSAGSDFRNEIETEIAKAQCVLVVWSKNSNASKWVRDEADEGLQRGILVPVFIERVSPPIGFRGVHAADLVEWRGDEDDPAFERLLVDVQHLGHGDVRATPAASPVRPSSVTSASFSTATATTIPWPGIATLGALVVAAGAAYAWWHSSSSRDAARPRYVAASSAQVFVAASAPAPKVVPAAAAASLPAPITVEQPPGEYFVMPTIGRKPDTSLRLVKASQKRNNITDTEDWWVANGLDSGTLPVPDFKGEGDVPDFVPARYLGDRVVKIIRGNPTLAIYGRDFSEGRYLLAIDPDTRQVKFALDFVLYAWPKSFDPKEREFVQMATTWAHLEGDVLYVSHRHRTYAKSSNGYNAYITAIDIKNNRVLWRSDPLVSSTAEFIVRGDAIVTAYGFTAEKRFMFVLNKADGRIVQRLQIEQDPEYLIVKDGRLFVRAYSFDYEFNFKDG